MRIAARRAQRRRHAPWGSPGRVLGVAKATWVLGGNSFRGTLRAERAHRTLHQGQKRWGTPPFTRASGGLFMVAFQGVLSMVALLRGFSQGVLSRLFYSYFDEARCLRHQSFLTSLRERVRGRQEPRRLNKKQKMPRK